MSESLNCTPPEMRKIAEMVTDNLLPEKSKALYMKAYQAFKNWCATKNVLLISESILLAYFQDYANDKKASTLWAHYSMLKSTLSLKEDIDISKYFKLVAFLKRQNSHYQAKKSSVFTQEEITTFINVAPDESYIAVKADLVVGVAGACRSDELCNLLLSDVSTQDDIIIINIRSSKNGSARKFVVMEPLWVEIIKKYLKIRPTPNLPKLFICVRNGKAVRQNIGHNTIGQMPKKIASYLDLKNPASYTGHSFRRTSATILANNGGNILQLKQHGGWKSSRVAEGYIEDSLSVKKSIACMVQGPSTSSSLNIPVSDPPDVRNSVLLPSTEDIHNTVINIPTATSSSTNVNSCSLNTSGPSINMTCHNCTVNYNFYK